MDKQSINTNSVMDQELETITGGSFDSGDSYGTDICATCKQLFRGNRYSLEQQENEHRISTGHDSFCPFD